MGEGFEVESLAFDSKEVKLLCNTPIIVPKLVTIINEEESTSRCIYWPPFGVEIFPAMHARKFKSFAIYSSREAKG